MSTSIYGIIEVRDNGKWRLESSDLDTKGQSYDAYACLFGIRNYVHFNPIAAERGIPVDCSLRRDDEFLEFYYNYSWIGYGEIQKIDLTKLNDGDNERAEVHLRLLDGTILDCYDAYKLLIRDCDAYRGIDHEQYVQIRKSVKKDRPIVIEGIGELFLKTKMSRGEAIGNVFEKTFAKMKELADIYGSENVRMVVGFD